MITFDGDKAPIIQPTLTQPTPSYGDAYDVKYLTIDGKEVISSTGFDARKQFNWVYELTFPAQDLTGYTAVDIEFTFPDFADKWPDFKDGRGNLSEISIQFNDGTQLKMPDTTNGWFEDGRSRGWYISGYYFIGFVSGGNVDAPNYPDPISLHFTNVGTLGPGVTKLTMNFGELQLNPWQGGPAPGAVQAGDMHIKSIHFKK
jgi:hypothetical protein